MQCIYSSIVIDDLYARLNEQSHVGIACLYADYKDQSNQTLVPILGSFLRQFLTSAPVPISDEVIQKLHTIKHQGRKPGTDDILALLKIRLHQLKRAFICIDALDELEAKIRQQLLSHLQDLAADNKNIYLFFTARGHIESEVQKRLKEVTEEYRVEISASPQDIQRFVRQQIKEDHDLNSEAMDTVLTKNIEDAIIENSKGM